MNNNLILRTLVSPYGDYTKGSVLSQGELDDNFIYLKGETIYSAQTISNTITLKKRNGNDITFNISGGSGGNYWTTGSVGAYSLKAVNNSGLDATGNYSLAEGYDTIASGDYSHAEGYGSTASSFASHAEGTYSVASGAISHAEGIGTTASGDYSRAVGADTIASGDGSYAGGYRTIASGSFSFVHGSGSTASGNSTIVLGGGVTGTTDNTVYVSKIVNKDNFTPTSSAHSAGENGSMAWDNSYFYYKSNNTWKRVLGSAF